MGAAKEELQAAVEGIDERQAELLLSILHLLRARTQRSDMPPGARERSAHDDVAVEALLLALWLDRERPSAQELRNLLPKVVSRRHVGLAWLSLTEASLGRDWSRPEEDEAWADL